MKNRHYGVSSEYEYSCFPIQFAIINSMIQLKCEACRVSFDVYPSTIKYNTAKYCSKACGIVGRYGPKLYKQCIICKKEFLARKNLHSLGYAKFCSRKCMGIRNLGAGNPGWLGDDVSYRGLHQWIENNYGKPNKCEGLNCSSKYQMYQWSNVSGNYKRNRDDWQMLCISCHRKYDCTDGTREKLRNNIKTRERNSRGELLVVK